MILLQLNGLIFNQWVYLLVILFDMDYYLKNLSILKGQPKKTICDYAESKGIIVPRRYESLKDCKHNKNKTIIRSEHEQDYHGVSDLFKSFIYTPEQIANIKTTLKLKNEIFPTKNFKDTHLFWYCKIYDVKKEQLKKEISFSYWDYIEGYNSSIIADSAIPDRFHIISRTNYKKNIDRNFEDFYVIIQDRKIMKIMVRPKNLYKYLKKNILGLVDLYQSVRNLDHFDKNHCPIIETITDKRGKHYFLQYHRARNFKASEFELARLPKKNEIKVDFVRGATKKEGETFKVINNHNWDKTGSVNIPPNADGTMIPRTFIPTFLSEKLARELKFQIIEFNTIISADLREHILFSKMFKPQISVFLKNIYNSPIRGKKNWKVTSLIDLYIISDGNKAYIKRIK